MADAVLIGAEAVVVAAWGAVTGAGRATAVVWVADRPRRRRIRTVRRRLWWRRGRWWRLLIGLELVGVGAWVGARSAARVLRATPTVATAAAAGGRDGWRTGRDQARARRQPPTTPAGADRSDGPDGPDGVGVVDAEVLCSWAGCITALTSDDPGPYCLVHATTSGAAAVTATTTDHEDVTVKVTVTAPEISDTREAATAMANHDDETPSRSDERPRPGPGPVTDAARRLEQLRAAGYRGPVRDGYAVASMDLDAPVLTPDEIGAAIAGGGYPPGSPPWPVPDLDAINWRKAALRAAGWAGPVSGDGYAVHGLQPVIPLAAALARIEKHATEAPSCCRCVLDPSQPEEDQVALCRCVIGEGVPREECTCGPWDLARAIAFDDEMEALGGIDADDRMTCHTCRDWADHAHLPFDRGRISPEAYGLQQELRGYPQWRGDPALLPEPGLPGSDQTDHTEAPVGHPADGPGPTGSTPTGPTNQHDIEHHDQEDDDMSETSEMTITSGAGGTTVTGRAGVGGQLTAVGDLIAEVAQLQVWTETGLVMLGDLEDWAAGLPDQVAGADWGTEAVTAAAIGLSEARTITEVRDRITVLLAAAAEAARLGEQLAAGGARGGVTGLRPQ